MKFYYHQDRQVLQITEDNSDKILRSRFVEIPNEELGNLIHCLEIAVRELDYGQSNQEDEKE